MKQNKVLLSPKNTMFATVVVFFLLALIILMGMFTPLIAKLTTGAEIRLEPAYFNDRTAIPTAILVILLSICMLTGYMEQKSILKITMGYMALSLFFAIVSPFNNMAIDVSIPLIVLALFATIYKIGMTLKRDSVREKLRGVSAHIIHLGILFILLGIVLSTNMRTDGSSVIHVGGTGRFPGQDYAIQVDTMESYYSGTPFQGYPGSSYITDVHLNIFKNGVFFKEGKVQYITDFKWGQSYISTFIHRGLTEELFIAPKAISLQNQEINLYVRTVPYINFLWGGFYMMVAGITSLIFVDRNRTRYTSMGGKGL